jgi:two-component system nitrogen regulation sensor histidine kinase NtrY
MLEKSPLNTEIAEKKRRKRERFIIFVVFFLVIILTSLEVYFSGTKSQLPITNNILVYGLVNINIILLLLLIFLVVRNVTKLIFERRRGVLGSKLRTKLVAAFIGLSLVPTFLLFWVASTFINTTIEGWFSFQVEESLEESMRVAKVYYKNSEENALYYARQISNAITRDKLLNENNLDKLKEFIKIKQEEYNLGVVEVFSAQLEELVQAMNPRIPAKKFMSPESNLVKEGLAGNELTKIESVGKGDFIRGIVPIYSTWNGNQVVGTLVVNYYVPNSLVKRMHIISSAFKEYHQAKLLKEPIKLSYLLTFSIVTLLIIFFATWFGFYLAKSITGPIQKLAEGTQEIARGNLEFQIQPASDDEVGSLINSFNQMTSDLRNTTIELERRRRYMEIVLKNVAAGVISVDNDGKIATMNKSAETMLEIKSEGTLNRYYREAFSSPSMEGIRELIRDMNASAGGTLERPVKISLPSKTLILLANTTALRDEAGNYIGLVLVFEDLTHLQRAQRAVAWREVARRIAHEIKNPLTPIQLCAQRLRKRYLDSFAADGKVFDDCTRTIINQVEQLKTLVNEFSNFARMPATEPQPNNLNEIIEETLILYRDPHRNVIFEFEKKGDIPTFNLDRDQIKRVLINLVDNALDAMKNDNGGKVTIETSYEPSLQMATIQVADTGCGIPPGEKTKLFEPYFSTKKSGTGLGLAIVNSIITDHNGYIRIKNNYPKGTRFIIELPIKV